jgi:hypothetical protein
MSSAIQQINTLLASLSFAEKLTLIEQMAGEVRKEGGGVKPAATKGGKRSKKGSKSGDAGSDSEAEAKPKRKAAAGTLAWTAFVKHIKETQPAAFEGVTKESDKLRVIKGIRSEDMVAYDSFVKDWKEKYAAAEKSDASSVAEEAEEAEEAEAAPAPVAVAAAKPKTAAEKVAELKAAKLAATASASAPAPAATPKKPVKTTAAAKGAPGAPKKAGKPAEAKEAKATEEPQMDQIDIDGKMYWHDPATHGLWEVTGKTFAEGSTWMGYFQPGNDEEPIRYTEAFGDE